MLAATIASTFILCGVGDSLSAGPNAWIHRMGLSAQQIRNASKPGATTKDFVVELWYGVELLEPCDRYAILLGTNDARQWRSEEAYADSLETLALREPEPTILITPPLLGLPGHSVQLLRYREQVLGICERHG